MIIPKWLEDQRDYIDIINKRSKYPIFNYRTDRLFLKLIADDLELEKMWKAIRKRDKSKLWFLEFHDAIEIALSIPEFVAQTAKDRNKYGNKIAKLSNELSLLLIESGFDDSLYSALRHYDRSILFNNIEPDRAVLISSFLMQVSEMAIKKRDEKRSFKASSDKKAEQTHFIKVLTLILIERFGQPLRGVVATAAAIIFDNHAITAAHVSSTAKA